MLEPKYITKIRVWYGDELAGSQLIHESNDTHVYIIYLKNGGIEIARLFPSYLSDFIEMMTESVLKGIDHRDMSLGDLMQLVELVTLTIKGGN